jgi:hypothetical protein
MSIQALSKRKKTPTGEGGRAMIFRHFLNATTGCASYLFG